ncbi:MAG: VWA domain-containing protein [Proteobacteria bacterium]|nr:VWA domain-containing protein [Pseudomonadota bacterium]
MAKKYFANIANTLATIGFVGAQIGAVSLMSFAPVNAQNAKVIKSKYYGEDISEMDFKCPTPKYDSEDARNYGSRTKTLSAPSVAHLPASVPPPPPPAPPLLVERKTATISNIAPSPVEESNIAAQDTSQVVAITGTKMAKPVPNSAPNPYAIAGEPNTEAYPKSTINSVKSVADQPVSTFAMEVDSASYANSRRMINQGEIPGKDEVRVEEFLNYFKYQYQNPSDKNAPFSTNVTVAPSPWNKDKKIVHIGLQGYSKTQSQRPPLNLVLLLDVSGSMSDENKLPLAKKAIRTLLPQLDSRDHVSMVVYAGASGVVLNPTKGNETRDIVCAMENLQAGGSTAGGQGIELAYKLAQQNFQKDGVNRIALLTDGDFNVGIYDPERLKSIIAKKRESGIYLSVFGFGGDNYDDETMQALAQNGNGIAAYVDTLSEARKIFRDDFSANMFPIANDVKAQVEFNPKSVAEWRLVGYETRALNREDFNNDKVDAGEIGAGHQVTAIYEITPIGAKMVNDPLRYQNDAQVTPSKNGEIAFLRLRYKLPGENQSKLIERAITPKDEFNNLTSAPNSTKFALAVASFGQKLRQDPWIGDYKYSDIINLAQSSEGAVTSGLDKEFIELVKKADSLSK